MKILRAWLKKQDKPAYVLAGEVDISQTHMSRILSGKRKPSGEVYGRLHARTGIPIETMIAQAGKEDRDGERTGVLPRKSGSKDRRRIRVLGAAGAAGREHLRDRGERDPK